MDKWDIRQDAAIELSKILYVLQEYPNMKIDIRSHTDSRQSHTYNLKLSENRSFRIEDIQALSVKEGYDVFKFRGGWYHNPNTDNTTPYCRHFWEQRIVRKK